MWLKEIQIVKPSQLFAVASLEILFMSSLAWGDQAAFPRGVARTQAVGFPHTVAHLASVGSSQNKPQPADHPEITVRVTGSQRERQKVRGNMELRKEGMQQLPISGTRWSYVIQLMVWKWLGKSHPNCEGRQMSRDKKCSPKVFVHKFNLVFLLFNQCFPSCFSLRTMELLWYQ